MLIAIVVTPGINSIFKCSFRRAHSHSGVGFSSLACLSGTRSCIGGFSRFLRVIDGFEIAGEEEHGDQQEWYYIFKIGDQLFELI
jgi:hypothetical protein